MSSTKQSIGKSHSQSVVDAPATEGASRRGFLKGGLAFVGGAAAASFVPTGDAAAQAPAPVAGVLPQLQAANGRPILFRGGMILSMDPQVGDFENGEVLIQGKKIVAVGQRVQTPPNTLIVDAANRILMPGMFDTHHHSTDATFRSVSTDSIILEFPNSPGPKLHWQAVMGSVNRGSTPDDVYIAELVFNLSAINAGTTTTVDVSGTGGAERGDAAIAGIKKAGNRVRLMASAAPGPATVTARLTDEINRLQKAAFSSTDQLLTLGVGGDGPNVDAWKVAKSFQLPIGIHFWGRRAPLDPVRDLLGPDVTFWHFSQVPNRYWKWVADAGAHVSIAPAIDMQMRQGWPAVQKALDFGIKPCLSSDVNSNMSADSFTLMRTAYLAQRAEINNRVNSGDVNVPPLLTSRQAIEFATINGAKAMQLDAKIGSLTPGKEADIVFLATDRINVFPVNNVPGAIVTLMDTSNVDAVFVAGEVKKWQGQLVGVDMNQLKRTIEQSRDRAFERNKYQPKMFDTCCAGPELPDASAP